MNKLLVKQLRCEYRNNPIGLGVTLPRFSWQLESDSVNVMQQAYHIQVSSGINGFNTNELLWDSGKVQSEQSVLVEYAGQLLDSRVRCHYRVKVWDQAGTESDWSEPAYWEMGLLQQSDWSAAWITPNSAHIDPQSEEIFLLRNTFDVRDDVNRATVYATALGIYELELNGQRIGDWQYTPGWTSYSNRLQVQAYDVTSLIHSGEHNAIGAALANGWYKGNLAWEKKNNIYGDQRALIMQLHIDYADGTSEIVVSDNTWQAATGPILLSELYHGETYDARLEKTGWSTAAYEDGNWAAVQELAHTKDILVMQESEPSRITERIKPIALIHTPAGETVLDMGQNMVGRIHLKLDLPTGTCLTLQHAEVLDRNGNFYIGNLRNAKQTVQYTCKGGGEEYEPHFSFQGFRYVKVEGWPEKVPLDLELFTGHVIHTDMEPSGTFECSHPLLNQLQRNIVWGQRGNFLDVPTDCPQRDERLGWTGDAQVFIRTAAFNYGVGPFFTKWLRDLKADQRNDGGVPFVIPNVLDEKSHSSSAWGDAAVICPWTIYLCYEDKRILEEQYDSMKAWVEYIRQQGDNEYLWNTGFHFGDWLGLDAKEGSYIGATPRDLIATCFYAYSTELFVKAAEVLGRTEDVAHYRELYEGIVAAFEQEFLTGSGRLAAHTQTGHVLPLMFGLVKGSVRERLARTLAEYVKEQNYHLTTGFVGTPYLCTVLSENGYHDVAVKLVQQEDYPSWLYSIHQGATTIWEHWDGIKPDGTFWSDDMNSYNHYAYGSIGEWLYRIVAGLDLDESQPGYKRIRFAPRTDSGLEYAKASYASSYGLIRSEWKISDESQVAYEFELPPNTTAEAWLHGAALSAAEVNDVSIQQAAGILSVKEQDGGLLLELGSGTYRIVVSK
ncbi:alpha-L-rhamnosidase [Paenibacillus cellulosilyticus]|uniref:alpha-L-rhamnosidase n=1 Tax=Paenibacillus cellulosilyticus TaxID=375489 RepID=A0A2V2YWW4_9BACL|nr:alpha-L-rhamnosidase [Paenibacillus cellulosilyticus]PWW05733.1 alpha-L-rhamnosidase [Paenibacillus cellulosilyticus]QKS45254.1 family 78 glycoside hydrolase catalytic domain [Paenibacillus cellulosilyticus]